jgi:hypothetical protein
VQCSGSIIDEVIWDGGPIFPDPNGASMALKTAYFNSVDNDNGANWETATAAYGDGDLGTPGAANSVSVESVDIEGLKIYPNPVSNGKITIETLNNSVKEIEIIDVTGKQIFKNIFSGSKNEINLEKINTGIYILKVIESGKTAITKLIVK